MKYKSPLISAVFLKRYKRFFADIEIEGKKTVAHVPNTGSLMGCLVEGSPCRVTHNPDPKRKLKYTLEMIKPGQSWVGVNTQTTNRLAWEAWEKKVFKHWSPYKSAQREKKLNEKTRLDLVLDPDSDRPHFIEVKNVTLCENGLAQFPDAITTRGQKHLRELIDIVKNGGSAEMLYVIQREDAEAFSPADHIDPEYGALLREAEKEGVFITAVACELSAAEILIAAERKIKVVL